MGVRLDSLDVMSSEANSVEEFEFMKSEMDRIHKLIGEEYNKEKTPNDFERFRRCYHSVVDKYNRGSSGYEFVVNSLEERPDGIAIDANLRKRSCS